ncbi:MAG TPA: glycosyltransferase family 2 protein [Gammaproteobacteria bacterium]|nr:glycosyltransferase family 2 protein [Gammaproteobacteria bacterium]
MDWHAGLPWILAPLAILASLFWCFMRGIGALSLARLSHLKLSPLPDLPLPRLSIVIAALDEEETLEPALRSLLAQDYPGLEIVLVDDRSMDGTGAIMERLAAADPRLTVVHVKELPAGWLGKVNALREGFTRSHGEYVLFTDADIHYAPGALRAALALAAAERLDHLTLLPRLRIQGFAHRVFMQAATISIARFTGGRRGLTEPSLALGIGAFNLVRREAFAATEGFEWFRMDVVDDMALGRLMRRPGARCGFAYAEGALEVLIYPSVAATVRGVEKNFYGALARYSPARAAVTVACMLLIAVGPFLAFLPGMPAWLQLFPAAAILSLAAEAFAGWRRFDMHFLPGLLAPFADLIAAYALARSAWLCQRQGGIRWRGTLYPLEQLRAGRRVSFP